MTLSFVGCGGLFYILHFHYCLTSPGKAFELAENILYDDDDDAAATATTKNENTTVKHKDNVDYEMSNTLIIVLYTPSEMAESV
jgi:hypothetical protein